MIDALTTLAKFAIIGFAGWTLHELAQDWFNPSTRALRAWHRAVRRYGLHSDEARIAYDRYLNVSIRGD
jgi:hypothetical protein